MLATNIRENKNNDIGKFPTIIFTLLNLVHFSCAVIFHETTKKNRKLLWDLPVQSIYMFPVLWYLHAHHHDTAQRKHETEPERHTHTERDKVCMACECKICVSSTQKLNKHHRFWSLMHQGVVFLGYKMWGYTFEFMSVEVENTNAMWSWQTTYFELNFISLNIDSLFKRFLWKEYILIVSVCRTEIWDELNRILNTEIR